MSAARKTMQQTVAADRAGRADRIAALVRAHVPGSTVTLTWKELADLLESYADGREQDKAWTAADVRKKIGDATLERVAKVAEKYRGSHHSRSWVNNEVVRETGWKPDRTLKHLRTLKIPK